MDSTEKNGLAGLKLPRDIYGEACHTNCFTLNWQVKIAEKIAEKIGKYIANYIVNDQYLRIHPQIIYGSGELSELLQIYTV